MSITHVVRTLAALALVSGAWFAVTGPAVVAGAAAPAAQKGGKSAPATAVPDLSTRTGDRCAVRDPSGEDQLAIDQAAASAVDDQSVVTIPVYWHIVTTTAGRGNVSRLVPAQMQVLNDAFAHSGFAFELKSVRTLANDAWFNAEIGSPDEQAMKAALRTGGPDALNIYTTNGDIYLGWATFPFYYKFAPTYDGVVLWWAALPGTGLAGASTQEPDGTLTYDQGDTGTHEVGHWLGLHHTFAGGCSHPGDSIKDTPAEARPQFFCAPRDSCLGAPFPGADAITNFMNYVDDVCMDRFTGDQTKRMRKHWHAFRDKKSRS